MSLLTQPAEWEKHSACWIAWPFDESLWQENLLPAQSEFTALCKAIHEGGEKLKVLVANPQAQSDAKKALHGLDVEFFEIPYGDIWLRDTAPIFLKKGAQLLSAVFAFNGWGDKYVLENDDVVAQRVAEASGHPFETHAWVLEGGSVESDGEGTLLTSKQCLLNPNRNPNFGQEKIEQLLAQSLGAKKVLWLSEGLLNDHTDGHIDTIARFVGPATVMCMEPTTERDPNAAVLRKIKSELETMSDAKGRKLRVLTVPSPGEVLNREGDLMPASYLNFYISNKIVIVPLYGAPSDREAVKAIQKGFQDRKVLGLSAKSILSGGGAFHCITQQEVV